MSKRLTVVVSQSQSQHPAKRQLEEDIVAGLLLERGIDVTVIPNLYDLKADSTGMLALQGISGDLVVCSWLFERAAHWILDRNQICGQTGTTLLKNEDEQDDQEEEEELGSDDKSRVIDHRDIPNRHIYCLDLKSSSEASAYIQEIKRIHAETNVQVVNLGSPQTAESPIESQRQRMAQPTNTTSLAIDGSGLSEPNGNGQPAADDVQALRIEESVGRRWYPVIDYSRCTNCLECIDFCLFGVYGVDKIDTILVEQPDNCRKGCPACSRVCPENAIIFPQHKTPAIAGSADVTASLKIDLSQLFGAPDQGKTAEQIAAQERDEQLILAGRDAVGMGVGMPKRHERKSAHAAQRDELDELVDQLDELDI